MKNLPLVVRLSLCVSVLLLCVAGAHKMMLDSRYYTNSYIVSFEIMLLVTVYLTGVAQLVSLVYFLIKKIWRSSAQVLMSLLLTLICIVISMLIDAETMVYAT